MPLPKLTITLNNRLSLKRLSLIIICLVLLTGNIFFAAKYSTLQKELEETKQTVKTQQINERVLSFTELFISKVLKAEEEVSFEDRLKLENSVRALEDEEILAQWQRFIETTTEEQAQNEVKNLLEILVKKIEIQ